MRIAHLGTFDVANYGDLLFPAVVRRRLSALDCEVVHVSPAGHGPIWSDCAASMGFEELVARKSEFSGIVVGGGNLVHLGASSLEKYGGGVKPLLAYPDLWIGASVLAAREGIPICWNCPGVPLGLAGGLVPLVRWALEQVDYLSVRDAASRRAIEGAAGGLSIEVVPDSCLEVPSLWAADDLDRAYREVFSSRGRDTPPCTLAFHVKERYSNESPEVMASRLDRICRLRKAVGILLALGPCHGDDVIAERTAAAMKTGPVLVNAPSSLLEVTACIARSEAYLGSSLHGFISSCSFGVRGMLIASSNVEKFGGFLEQFGLSGWLLPSWQAAEEQAGSFFDADPAPWRQVSSVARPALDRHWETIRATLAGRRSAAGRSEEAVKALLELTLRHFSGKEHRALILEAAAVRSLERGGELAMYKEAAERLGEEVRSLRSAKRELELAKAVANEDHRLLVNWVERLHRIIKSFEASRRWKIGDRIGRLCERLRLVRKPLKTAPEEARDVMAAFALWRRKKVAPLRGATAANSMLAFTSGITVIVPIYNAFEAARRCIESLFSNTRLPCRILVIDDGSTDAEVWPWLERLAAENSQVQAVRNPQNLGYTRTVNLGCRLAGRDDVVLLNSDTAVTPGWLAKLSAAAYSRPNVATVTPLSNAAGAFSVPQNHVDNSLGRLSTDEMGLLLEEISQRIHPEVPTANGFCVYIRRDALESVGGFDEQSFPRGYGEENDFCMRASAKGYVHLVEDSTFVFHQRSASFGEQRKAIAEASARRLDALHPGYKVLVSRWLKNDPLDVLRLRLKQALDAGWRPTQRGGTGGRRTILYLIHNGAGGSVQTTEDLLQALAGKFRCLLLKADLEQWSLVEALPERLETRGERTFTEPWRIADPLDDERREALRQICREHQVSIAHIRGLIGTHPEIIPLLKSLGVQVVFSFHDAYTICPTVGLIDNRGSFCGGICNDDQQDCSVSRRWFTAMPRLKNDFVYRWRERVQSALAPCDAFVVSSESARRLISSFHPFINGSRLFLIEHGRDLEDFEFCSRPPAATPVRVVFFGALGEMKGTALVEEVMRRDYENGARFEFHILGNTTKKFKAQEYGGIIHGPYARASLPLMLKEISPSFALLPSICFETHCHILTEAWAAGIPVLASDRGAIRERVGRYGGGWLLDPEDPAVWYEALLRLSAAGEEYERRREELRHMRFVRLEEMAAHYIRLYEEMRTSVGVETALTGEPGAPALSTPSFT